MKNIFKTLLAVTVILCLSLVLFSCQEDEWSYNGKGSQSESVSESASESSSEGASESESECESESESESESTGGLANKGDLSTDGWGPIIPVN